MIGAVFSSGGGNGNTIPFGNASALLMALIIECSRICKSESPSMQPENQRAVKKKKGNNHPDVRIKPHHLWKKFTKVPITPPPIKTLML